MVADPSVPIDGELLDVAGDGLKVVANFAVGYDNVDLDACRDRGVIVTNTPDVLTEATAELAMALTFAAARRMSDAERDLRAGRWGGWDPAAYRGIEIRGSTVGVVGMGRIGSRYALLAHGLGARSSTRAGRPSPTRRGSWAHAAWSCGSCSRSPTWSASTPPRSPETRGLIGAAELRADRPGGRAGQHLARATGRLRGRGRRARVRHARCRRTGRLRVRARGLARLLAAPRAVLLPHIGSATIPSRDGMAGAVADNVIAVLEGREPPSRVA